MYEFESGKENVTATLLGEGALADPRRGFRTMAAVNSHELSHQWFGDCVTFKDWGDLWLSEGFATFFTNLYLGHSRGKAVYDQGIERWMQNYFSEGRRYQRPLSTKLYTDPHAMMDRHSYGKGAVVMHTLRRHLGDKPFFEGIRHYLKKHRYQPVDSHDFCQALTEATGINLEPFFDQWVFKPGHPVLDYGWKWDEEKKQVVLTVKQKQNTKDGTPIYDLNVTVGVIAAGSLQRTKVKIDKAELEIPVNAASKPDAVLLDPDHDFLREIPALLWRAEELPAILKHAPNAVDREEAMKKMLEGTPADAVMQAVVEAIRADKGQFPVFRSVAGLGELKRADLRPLFRDQLAHPDLDRRAQAIRALGRMPRDTADVTLIRGLINDREPYDVVKESVVALKTWDAVGNRNIFEKAVQAAQEHNPTRLAALDALAEADAAAGKERPNADPDTTARLRDLLTEMAKGATDSPHIVPGFRRQIPRGQATIARWLKDLKSLTFLAQEDVSGKGEEANGARVSRLRHYKLITGQDTLYLTFHLTADGKVAEMDVER
jgi:aminopeptidase N